MTEEQEKIYTTVKSITLEKGVHNLSDVMKKFEEDDEFSVICNPNHSNFKDEEADVQEDKSIGNLIQKMKDNVHGHIKYEGIAEYKPRYYDEAYRTFKLSLDALNHSKNVNKQAGRDYDEAREIISLLRREVVELEEAIAQNEANCFDNTKRSKEELGDVGACLVLLLDWINSREEK